MKVFDCIVTTGEIHTLRIFELHSVLLQAIMGSKGNGGIGRERGGRGREKSQTWEKRLGEERKKRERLNGEPFRV